MVVIVSKWVMSNVSKWVMSNVSKWVMSNVSKWVNKLLDGLWCVRMYANTIASLVP